MKVDPACFPCALSRSLCTARRITDDAWLHHRLLDAAMQELVDSRKDVSPAEIIFALEGVISKTLGAHDPYQSLREEWHVELEAFHDKVEGWVASDDRPLRAACRIAAQANVFDDELLTRRQLRAELKTIGRDDQPAKFVHADFDIFEEELQNAESLLFLHDSGPELLFDRELFRNLTRFRPELRITSVVRHGPVLLDAIASDAERYGLAELEGVEAIIDPGIDALGLPLNECSREFRERFDAADIVLAKGQAHFETLKGCGRHIYHLMRVKCGVMAKVQGCDVGDLVFLRS